MTQSTIGPYPESAPAHPTPWTYSAATGRVEDALGNRLFVVERIALGQDLVSLVNRASGSDELAPRVRARIEESIVPPVWGDAIRRAAEPRVFVGDTFDGVTEPDVPVGAILRDSEGDQVEHVEPGRWRYVILNGDDVREHVRTSWRWDEGSAYYGPYTLVSLP